MTLRELQKKVDEFLESMDGESEVRLQGIAGSTAECTSVVMDIDEETDEESVVLRWQDEDDD